MSDEDLNKLKSHANQSKWYSIITAVIVLIKTIVDILMK